MPRPLDYQGAIALFAGGQAGFYFQGEWEITTFQTAKTPFSMTLFPNVYGGGQLRRAGRLAHPGAARSSRPRPRAQLDRVADVHPVDARPEHDLGRGRPRAGVAAVPRTATAYKKLTPQSNYAAAADAAVYDPTAWYSGSGSDFEIIIGAAIGAVDGRPAVTDGRRSPRCRRKLTVLAKTQPPI